MYIEERSLELRSTHRRMTEENVVALRWLISSLETRIIDLEAGRLDESLEDLAKNPIPVQYLSLCQELKCVFPSILTMAEYANNAIAASTSAAMKDTSIGKMTAEHSSSGSIPNNNPISNTAIKPATTTDTYRINTAPIAHQNTADLVNPSAEHGTRKRKFSIGDAEEKKNTVKAAEIKILSPEKQKKNTGSEEIAAASSLASKLIDDQITPKGGAKRGRSLSTTTRHKISEEETDETAEKSDKNDKTDKNDRNDKNEKNDKNENKNMNDSIPKDSSSSASGISGVGSGISVQSLLSPGRASTRSSRGASLLEDEGISVNTSASAVRSQIKGKLQSPSDALASLAGGSAFFPSGEKDKDKDKDKTDEDENLPSRRSKRTKT